MKILLGEKSKLLDEYASRLNAIPASEMCGIKFIKEEVDLYIISKILDNGFIENTSLSLEEVLITLNVKNVYYKFHNAEYLTNCSLFYQVKIYTDYSV
jgi:hypothetical protein